MLLRGTILTRNPGSEKSRSSEKAFVHGKAGYVRASRLVGEALVLGRVYENDVTGVTDGLIVSPHALTKTSAGAFDLVPIST